MWAVKLRPGPRLVQRNNSMPAKILIVDDDNLMLEILRIYMARHGFEIVVAREGLSALQAAQETLPSVIIMDVIMPGPGGLEVVRHLRKLEATRQIPVIIITSNDSPLLRKEADFVGAAAFVVKPFGPAQLLAEIKRVLPPAPAAPANS